MSPALRSNVSDGPGFWAVVLCLSLWVGAGPAHAQSDLTYGVRLSAVASTTTDRLAGVTDWLWGGGGTAYVERRLAEGYGARLEVGYAPRGVRQVFFGSATDVSGGRTEAETRLHYLSTSLFARADGSLGPLRFYVLLGPRVDLLVGRRGGTFVFREKEVRARLADRYDRVSFGASGGIGVELGIGDVGLTLELLQHRDIVAPVDEGSTSTYDYTSAPLRNLANAYSLGVRW